jgi:alkylhydroperoxidase family enzyme
VASDPLLPTVADVDGHPVGARLAALEAAAASAVAAVAGAAALGAAAEAIAAVLHGRPRRPHGASAGTTSLLADVAEQFVLDANGVTPALGRPLRAELGRAGAVASMLWVGLRESRERLRILLGAAELGPDVPAVLAGAGPDAGSRTGPDDGVGQPWPRGQDGPDAAPPTLAQLLEATVPDLARRRAELGAMSPGPLDPRIREMVRLTSADAVDCRYCRSVRYRDERGGQLVDEGLRAALGAGAEGAQLGSAAAAAAVAVARAFLAARPASDAERTAAAAALGRDELLDLLVTVQRFPAGSKAMVALGLVPEHTPVTLL